MNFFDLQITSSVSDGRHPPQELIKFAENAGVFTVSLTDHDTVDGVFEAIHAGEALGVRVISGIEMSVAEESVYHLLGYGVDHTLPFFTEKLGDILQKRIEGVKTMMNRLKDNEGFVVTWEDVVNEIPGSKSITSLHVVRAIMRRPENKEKLMDVTKQEFYQRYLSRSGPNYVHKEHITVKDAVGLIHDAGGVAVWSHPILQFRIPERKYAKLEETLQELLKIGIDGIEVFSSAHSEDDVEFLYELSQKYNLLRTGGSDFHDAGEHIRDPETGLHSADTIGDFETYGFDTSDIILRLDEAIAARKEQ